MNKNDQKTLEAIERALNAANECYYAFNHLAVVKKVSFYFAATDLYDAIKLLQGWSEKLKEKG